MQRARSASLWSFLLGLRILLNLLFGAAIRIGYLLLKPRCRDRPSPWPWLLHVLKSESSSPGRLPRLQRWTPSILKKSPKTHPARYDNLSFSRHRLSTPTDRTIMAVFWVQYCEHLPSVIEGSMTDGARARLSSGSHRDPSIPSTDTGKPEQHPTSALVPYQSIAPSTTLQAPFTELLVTEGSGVSHPGPAPYLQQTFAPPVVTQAPLPDLAASSSSLSASAMQSTSVYAPLPHRDGPHPYGMTTLGSSYPDLHSSPSFSSFPQHRLSSNHSSSMMYQLQQIPQFAGQTAFSYQGGSNWMTLPFAHQYSTPFTHTAHTAATNAASHNYPHQLHGQPSHYAVMGSQPYQYSGATWNFQQQQQGLFQPFFMPGGFGHGSPARSRARYAPSPSRRPSAPQVDIYPRVQEIQSRTGSADQASGGFVGLHQLQADAAGNAPGKLLCHPNRHLIVRTRTLLLYLTLIGKESRQMTYSC